MAVSALEYPKIDYTQDKLKNGLRVVMSVDRRAPIVAVNLWYDVGSRDETQGKTGLAHLFEHMMFQGSANIEKGGHFSHVSSAGGVTNASTATFRTNYFEYAPSHHLETLLWLEADRLGSLDKSITQEKLDNQRAVVKNERRQTSENTPYGEWLEKTQSLLFPEDHPYHHSVIGSMEDLDGANLKDVKNFFTTHYAPNNAVLSIVGDFDPKQAKSWVQKYFGGIPSNSKLPKTPSASVPMTLGGEVKDMIRDRVSTPGVFISYRTPGEGTRENDILAVAGAVLSLGRGSRMYERLILEQVALQAQFLTVAQPDVSMTVALGICFPGTYNEQMEEKLTEVVDSLKNEPATDAEMNRARTQIESQYIQGRSTVSSRADLLSEHATLFGDPGKVNERLSDLMSVSASDISAVAKDVLVPDNRTVVSVLKKAREFKQKDRDKMKRKIGA